jgi:hypothetical protein
MREYCQQQAGSSPFLECLIGFLLGLCTDPGVIESITKVDARECLLILLRGVEECCVHPLNCDALAWRINRVNRPFAQMFLPL